MFVDKYVIKDLRYLYCLTQNCTFQDYSEGIVREVHKD